MMTGQYTELREPCKKCPFRRNSLPGWLGPWAPEELLRAISLEPFPCHCTITTDGNYQDNPHLRGCAGTALFLNNKCEISRSHPTERHQKEIKNEDGTGVFSNSREFLAHHQRESAR